MSRVRVQRFVTAQIRTCAIMSRTVLDVGSALAIILRHNGVDIGKQDFLRPINFVEG
jgi:hypothetical protein